MGLRSIIVRVQANVPSGACQHWQPVFAFPFFGFRVLVFPSSGITMRKHLLGAVLAGLALRLFLVWKFPLIAGDTVIYDQLARNWLDHSVYGLWLNGTLVPVDMRVPGYPAFIAAVFSLFGRSLAALMVVQAFLDMLTCLLAGAIAAWLAPESSRPRV